MPVSIEELKCVRTLIWELWCYLLAVEVGNWVLDLVFFIDSALGIGVGSTLCLAAPIARADDKRLCLLVLGLHSEPRTFSLFAHWATFDVLITPFDHVVVWYR